MKVLGLDASAKTGSIALCDDDRLVAEVTLEMERSHSERLMPALDAVFPLVGREIGQTELVAVALGPGSFTGLRVGVATAKSLAFSLNVPIVGVPTFDAIAFRHRHSSADLCVLLDARKREVYAARYVYGPEPHSAGVGNLRQAAPFRCIPLGDVLAEITAPTLFVGDAADAYREDIAERLGNLALLSDQEAGICRASAVATLGWTRWRENPTGGCDVHTLAPLYIRRPEAEVRRDGVMG